MIFSHLAVLAGLIGSLALAQSPSKPVAEKATPQVLAVKLNDGVERVVQIQKGSLGRSTIVLVNGLVYNWSRWDDMADSLNKKGHTVIRYYFRGQHETLVKELEDSRTPKFFETGLTSEAMGDELSELLKTLKIDHPVAVVGLSYGAHIAAQMVARHPEQVSHTIFLAPLVRSLDFYDTQGIFLRWNLEQIKFWWGPVLGPAFYDYTYNWVYRSFLNQRLVPEKIPSEFRGRYEDQYKESIFHLVRAVRDFDLRDWSWARIPERSVSFLLAKEDQEQIFQDQLDSVAQVKDLKLQSLIYMPEGGHAIPDSQGFVAAALVDLLVRNDERISKGEKLIFRNDRLQNWDGKP